MRCSLEMAAMISSATARAVSAITKAPVRETVPDSFLDRADEIELVDLTPRDLQRRLEEVSVGTSVQRDAGEAIDDALGSLT